MPAALIVQFALQYGIPAAQELISLLNRPNPTPADWAAVFDKAQTPFDQGLKTDALKP